MYRQVQLPVYDSLLLRRVKNGAKGNWQYFIGSGSVVFREFDAVVDTIDINDPTPAQIMEAKDKFYADLGDEFLSLWTDYKKERMSSDFPLTLALVKGQFDLEMTWSLTDSPKVDKVGGLDVLTRNAGAAWWRIYGPRFEEAVRGDYEAATDYQFAKFCSRSLTSTDRLGALTSFIKARGTRPKRDSIAFGSMYDWQAKEAVAQATQAILKK